MALSQKERREQYEATKEEFKFGSRTVEGGPKHVAILCDGNRRWAEQRGLEPEEGHREGAELIIRLMQRAGELGIETLTFWVGDTKNLEKRGAKHNGNLVDIFYDMAERFRNDYMKHDVRFRHIGDREKLPGKLQKIINDLEEDTKDMNTATLNVAFNYGGRDEIVRATKKILEDGLNPEDLTEERFATYLDTHDMPDPDLIIRPGKVTRLSGFMSWQSAPSELEFIEELFPDFTPDRFEEVINAFPQRERRFGK